MARACRDRQSWTRPAPEIGTPGAPPSGCNSRWPAPYFRRRTPGPVELTGPIGSNSRRISDLRSRCGEPTPRDTPRMRGYAITSTRECPGPTPTVIHDSAAKRQLYGAGRYLARESHVIQSRCGIPGGNEAAKSLAFPWISKSLFSLKTAMQEADRALRLENYAARDLANLRAGRAAYRFRECLACVCA